jgi:serine/threonine-protein kinase HipA
MSDIEVYIDIAGAPRAVGLLRPHAARGGETITFGYDPAWLAEPGCFSLEPALSLTRGVFILRGAAAAPLTLRVALALYPKAAR